MLNHLKITKLVILCISINAGIAWAQAATEPIHQRWAPVIMQGAASDADFITTADFDGNRIGNDNWDNFDKFPKPAAVYYDVKETASHWFIFYTLFHPRDYTPDPECPISCHENDAESIQVVIRKDGTPNGKLEIMQTLAHGDITLYTNEPGIAGGAMKVSGPITLTNGHPTIYVEQYGHGIFGTPGESVSANPLAVKIVRYLPTGIAGEPDGIPDKKVGYALVSIYDTLWQWRDCVGNGQCFDGLFEYRGAELPSQFDGDDFGIDSANTPWGYDQATGDGIVRGDWFFDPAHAILYHAGPIPDFATEYTFNPYLKDIEAEKNE